MTNNQLTSTHLAVKSELDGYKIHASRGQATAMAMVRLFESIDRDLEELQERRQATMNSEPVGWTDEQELRDVEKDGCGYLFKANPITPHADPRRVILLYRHAQPAPVVPEDVRQALSKMDDEIIAELDAEESASRAAMLHAGNSPAQSDCCPAQNSVAPAQGGNSLVIPDEMTSEQAYEIGYYYGDPVNVFARGANWMRQHIIDSTLAAARQSPGSEPATVPGKWIPVSEQMPPSRHEVLVGCWWGEKPRWCCKWATYIPCHPDAQSSGWLIPGASWTPTHWMELPAAPQEPKP